MDKYKIVTLNKNVVNLSYEDYEKKINARAKEGYQVVNSFKDYCIMKIELVQRLFTDADGKKSYSWVKK